MYTLQEWVDAVLAGLGNKSPAQAVAEWVGAWVGFETSNPLRGATYNPLNTTQYPSPDVEGITFFNTFGPNGEYHVLNFPTFVSGVLANVQCLSNGYYGVLRESLAANAESALYSPSPALNHNINTWGTSQSSSIGAEIAARAKAGVNMNVEFPGNGPIQPPPPPPPPLPEPGPSTWVSPEQEAAWLAEFQAVDPSVPADTGIASWHASEYRSERWHGPALCKEYASKTWGGSPIQVQCLAGGRAEFSAADDHINFFPYS
jgi:hypothetical protein